MVVVWAAGSGISVKGIFISRRKRDNFGSVSRPISPQPAGQTPGAPSEIPVVTRGAFSGFHVIRQTAKKKYRPPFSRGAGPVDSLKSEFQFWGAGWIRMVVHRIIGSHSSQKCFVCASRTGSNGALGPAALISFVCRRCPRRAL